MRKFALIILIIFSACSSSDEDICNENCWTVLQTGNLGATLKNNCNNQTKDYIYKNDEKPFLSGDVVCDIDFN